MSFGIEVPNSGHCGITKMISFRFESFPFPEFETKFRKFLSKAEHFLLCLLHEYSENTICRQYSINATANNCHIVYFFIPMTRVTKQRFSLMHHEFLLGELIIYEGVLAVGDKCTAKNFDDVQILMIFCVFMSWIRIKKQ